MIDQKRTADLPLPLDVSARAEGLFSLVAEIGNRVSGFPVLFELVRDYQEMAREYILLFESSLKDSRLEPAEKWLKQHEMLDKLTREWHVIYSLASALELGSSFLGKFKPYVDQAAEDIGLAESRNEFLLIPIFGPSFSLVTLGYSSSNVSILNLPISVIHAPWELSVVWHELAGLKVIRIRDQIRQFLEAYAAENDLTPPDGRVRPDRDPIIELFERITQGTELDEDLMKNVRDFLSGPDGNALGQAQIWSQDWFEQLYEDACSVFAFGEEFVSVLRTILSRQVRKLTSDRKHPDLETRIQVARRLLALQKGEAAPPEPGVQQLTDNLLWAFINQKRSDPVAALPVAYAAPENIPEVRRELIGHMQEFNRNFGNLEGGTINETRFVFGPMFEFAAKASQRQAGYISDEDRNLRVKEKLLARFESSGIDGLLSIPFSPADELNNFFSHGPDDFGSMQIDGGPHGVHTVWHSPHFKIF